MLPSRVDNCSFLNLYFSNDTMWTDFKYNTTKMFAICILRKSWQKWLDSPTTRMSLAVCLQEGEARALWWRVWTR